MKTLKIEFANEQAFKHFVIWMTESGEQQYWNWMEAVEEDEEGDVTVIDFSYHGPEDETKAESDPARYGEFMCDDTIRTECGRLSKR